MAERRAKAKTGETFGGFGGRPPIRHQRSRAKGSRLPAGVLCVSRGTKWGNPFAVDSVIVKAMAARMGLDAAVQASAHRAAIELYRYWVTDRLAELPRLVRIMLTPEQAATPAPSRGQLLELRGRDLACWCGLDLPCHADVLLELANPLPPAGPDRVGRPSLEQVLRDACAVVGIAPARVRETRGRKRLQVMARELFAVATQLLGYSYPQSAGHLGIQSHSTMVTAANRWFDRVMAMRFVGAMGEALAEVDRLGRVVGDPTGLANDDYWDRESPARQWVRGELAARFSPVYGTPGIPSVSRISGPAASKFVHDHPELFGMTRTTDASPLEQAA